MHGALFLPNTSHVEVNCWRCGHSVTLRRADVPDGISEHDFQARATCSKCGMGWPKVTQYPRPPSRWG